MSCPVCAGSTDVRELTLRSMCTKHLAEVKTFLDADIRAAFEEGLRMRRVALDAYVPPQFPSDLRFR